MNAQQSLSIEKDLLNKWRSMVSRCHGEHSKPTRYQINGIRVCDSWMGESGFSNFMEWSLSHGYATGLMIDRVDTLGDYCPDNCRYITRKENNRNRRDAVYVRYEGELAKLSELCEKLGLDYPHVYSYIRNGKSVHGITPEIRKEKDSSKYVRKEGKMALARKAAGFTQEQAAKALGVSKAAVSIWEAGKGNPLLENLQKMASLYNVPVGNLLSSDREASQ